MQSHSGIDFRNTKYLAMIQKEMSMTVQLSLTIDEVSAATGIGRTKIYEVLDSGELPAKKWGKRTLILKADLQKFLAGLESYSPQVGGKNE